MVLWYLLFHTDNSSCKICVDGGYSYNDDTIMFIPLSQHLSWFDVHYDKAKIIRSTHMEPCCSKDT